MVYGQRSLVVVHQRQQTVYTQVWKGGASMKEESKSVRVSLEAYETLRLLQGDFAKQVGFTPSITQVIEYLASKEMKERNKNGV